MSIEGFAEPPSAGMLLGWVWNANDPGRALHVEAFNGDTFYYRTVADSFRDDLLTAGKRAGLCKFAIPLPDDLEGEVHVILDGTGHRLPSLPSTAPGLIRDWLDADGIVFRPNLLVHRVTTALLGRSATRLELLKNMMQAGDLHAVTRLPRTILASAPDPMHEMTEEHLVGQVYLGVLARLADDRGMVIYPEALRSGLQVSQLIRELIQTPEFARLYAPASVPSGGNSSAELHELVRVMKATLATLMLHAAPGAPDEILLPE